MEATAMEGAAVDLSLVIPAYNEAAGIRQAIAEADDALRALGLRYEVLVVDDGSQDETAEVVGAVKAYRPHVRLLRHLINRGYGAALRTGFEAARGQRVAFTDADCQFNMADLALLLPLTETHAIAAGFRIDRQDSPLRKVYSRGYHWLIRMLLGTTVRDIDCALKIFRRDALLHVLPESEGFLVNTEMLTRARRLGLAIAEVGVRHRPRLRGVSKISLWDVPRTLRALVPFWWSQVVRGSNPGPESLITTARVQVPSLNSLANHAAMDRPHRAARELSEFSQDSDRH
jgi:dolichol-phosphate mannosyltransferase